MVNQVTQDFKEALLRSAGNGYGPLSRTAMVAAVARRSGEEEWQGGVARTARCSSDKRLTSEECNARRRMCNCTTAQRQGRIGC